jgi:hypothetical protein
MLSCSVSNNISSSSKVVPPAIILRRTLPPGDVACLGAGVAALMAAHVVLYVVASPTTEAPTTPTRALNVMSVSRLGIR